MVCRSGWWVAVVAVLAVASIGFYVRLQSASVGAKAAGVVTAVGSERTELLVVVIAGGNRPAYPMMRTLWRLIADRVREMGVVVYLIGFNPHLREDVDYNPESHSLMFRGHDSLKPGVLNQTILAFDYIMRKKLKGHDFKKLLRTNLSSFWRFDLLLHFLERLRLRPEQMLYGGPKYAYQGYPVFASGAGFVLNQVAVKELLEKRSELRYGDIDDVSLGHFFTGSRRAKLYPEWVMCFLENPKVVNTTDWTFYKCGRNRSFHFRVKDWFHAAYKDISIWNALYTRYYIGDWTPTKDDA